MFIVRSDCKHTRIFSASWNIYNLTKTEHKLKWWMIISSINKLPTVIKIQSLSEIYQYTVSDLLMTEKKCPSTYIANFKQPKTTCKLTSTTTSWHLYFLAMFNRLSEPSIILRYLDKILEKGHSINVIFYTWCDAAHKDKQYIWPSIIVLFLYNSVISLSAGC